MKKFFLFCLVCSLFAMGAGLRAESAAYRCSFARGGWNAADWLRVKSPRWEWKGAWDQMDDHVANHCPDVSEKELLRIHPQIYAAMVTKERFGGKCVEISSTMSFDEEMAPLIVLAEELGADAAGFPEFREHYEIVLYNKGLNVWHHTFKDGKPGWYKAAYLKGEFKPKTRYELKVKMQKTAKGKVEMVVSAGGCEFGFQDDDLPTAFHVGVIGCEGRNRFYDFAVRAK